ncbi:MAG: hypothetical protein WC533_04555 [Candidatus Pacearchaeota archaeon]
MLVAREKPKRVRNWEDLTGLGYDKPIILETEEGVSQIQINYLGKCDFTRKVIIGYATPYHPISKPVGIDNYYSASEIFPWTTRMLQVRADGSISSEGEITLHGNIWDEGKVDKMLGK